MSKVLVTGGTHGIGAGIAERLRAHGYEVLTCARSGNPTIQCDVTVRREVHNMADHIGAIDILINNVGGVVTAPFLQLSDEMWDWHFQQNVKSAVNCIQEFLPAMLQNQWGRIINIASTAGKIGGRYISAYVAAKHAVIGLTKSLALEVADQGVTVNSVCPSFVDTPMLRSSAEEVAAKTKRSTDEILDSFRKRNPQNRFITVEEVAATVQFLIEAPGINGQAISICGGETA